MIVVLNKCDLAEPGKALLARLAEAKVPVVRAVATRGEGVSELREALVRTAPEEFINHPDYPRATWSRPASWRCW